MSKITRMVTTWGFWLQVAIWVSLFLLPLTFVHPDEQMSLRLYLLRISSPFSQFIIFYINFLWLVPQFLRGKHWQFWMINAILIIILAFYVHASMEIFWNLKHPVNNVNISLTKAWSMEPMLLLREAFNLCVAIGIAVAIIMSRRWIETEKARQEADVARSEAELSNLRSQVNPHFLLNTLNNIYALTSFDPPQAQKAIMELASMLRHILYQTQEPYINMTEEKEFIESYISLMKRRITKNVEIIKDIEIPYPCSVNIAPMLLISLIENAFKHGTSPTEPSFIHIHIKASDECIICHIENSNFPKPESDQSGHGIGLKQVAKRLELSYHGKYKWERGLNPNTNIYSSKIILYDTKLRNH